MSTFQEHDHEKVLSALSCSQCVYNAAILLLSVWEKGAAVQGKVVTDLLLHSRQPVSIPGGCVVPVLELALEPVLTLSWVTAGANAGDPGVALGSALIFLERLFSSTLPNKIVYQRSTHWYWKSIKSSLWCLLGRKQALILKGVSVLSCLLVICTLACPCEDKTSSPYMFQPALPRNASFYPSLFCANWGKDGIIYNTIGGIKSSQLTNVKLLKGVPRRTRKDRWNIPKSPLNLRKPTWNTNFTLSPVVLTPSQPFITLTTLMIARRLLFNCAGRSLPRRGFFYFSPPAFLEQGKKGKALKFHLSIMSLWGRFLAKSSFMRRRRPVINVFTGR